MANRHPFVEVTTPKSDGGSWESGDRTPGPSGDRTIVSGGSRPGSNNRKGTPPRVSPQVSSNGGGSTVQNYQPRNSGSLMSTSQNGPVLKREYYDPAQLCESVGPNAIPWFLFRRCTTLRGKNVLRLAKFTLLFVAFLVSVAQWSVLASGVAFFGHKVGLNGYQSDGLTSAALSTCFLCCIAGGAFSDGRWGSNKVLTVGLSGAFIAAIVVTGLCYPIDALREHVAVKVLLSVAVFAFAGFLGFSLTALTTMMGDQCHNRPAELASMYNLYYGVIQFGAFVARAFFPLTDYILDWFLGIICFVTIPTAAGLLIFYSQTAIFSTKKPVEQSPVTLAFRILGRRLCGTTQEELACHYGEKMVRDSFRAASVLKVHLTLPVFWALYFQMFGLWYLQAKQMDLEIVDGQTIIAEQVTVVNPLFDVLCLAMFGGLFSFVKRCCNFTLPPTWKMLFGYFFALASFAVATMLQYRIEQKPKSEGKITIYWQLPQFFLICAAEILVYPPALHLAYVNSPSSMRGFVQSVLWFFIGLGNLLNAVLIFVTASAIGADELGDAVGHDKSKMPFYIIYMSVMGLATIVYAALFYQYDEHPADAETHNTRHVGPHAGISPREQVQGYGAAGGARRDGTPQHGAHTPPRGGITSDRNRDEGGGGIVESPPSAVGSGFFNSSSEQQPLLAAGTPIKQQLRRAGSGLSNGSFTDAGGDGGYAKKVRRVPTPKDPRLGGATYYSTRKSPRTSGLDGIPSNSPQPSPAKFSY